MSRGPTGIPPRATLLVVKKPASGNLGMPTAHCLQSAGTVAGYAVAKLQANVISGGTGTTWLNHPPPNGGG